LVEYQFGSRRNLKLLAIGLAVLVEMSAAYYLFTAPASAGTGPDFRFLLTTSTTKHTSKVVITSTAPPPQLLIQNVLLVNDSLRLDLKNTGLISTRNVSIVGVCTPGFTACGTYQGLSGSTLTKTFILPGGGEYWMNFTGVCVMPLAVCHRYLPTAGGLYYFRVAVGFVGGRTSTVSLAVKGNNTFPLKAAFQGMDPKLTVYSKNLSGVLSIGVLVNSSLNHASFASTLLGRDSKGMFTARLIQNRTSCGVNLAVDCGQGYVNITNKFSTVLTGITTQFFPGPYILTVQDLTKATQPFFAEWITPTKE
jgi:hypothetical protein